MTSNTSDTEPMVLAVDHAIKNRKTVKALGDINTPPQIPDNFKAQVQACIEAAGWAPFHFTAHEAHITGRDMNAKVPWRFYTFDQENCLKLAKAIIADSGLDADEASTIIRLMAACGSMILVTWLPEPEDSIRARDPKRLTMMNEEHLAATAAATQNLLVAATARDMKSYWSSGGVLRDWACFELCGIATQEKLLGSIFLYPETLPDNIEIRPGKLREGRGTPQQWMQWVSVSSQ